MAARLILGALAVLALLFTFSGTAGAQDGSYPNGSYPNGSAPAATDTTRTPTAAATGRPVGRLAATGVESQLPLLFGGGLILAVMAARQATRGSRELD